MQLPRDGQEYAHITFQEGDLPFNVPVEASIDDRATWVTTLGGDTPLERKLLLRGPDSRRTEGLLITRPVQLWVRVTDNPEEVVRSAGQIFLD